MRTNSDIRIRKQVSIKEIKKQMQQDFVEQLKRDQVLANVPVNIGR